MLAAAARALHGACEARSAASGACTVVAFLALLAAPTPLQGQEGWTGRKSAWAAGVLEYVVPTAGYAYAGAWKEGLLPGAVRISGTVALLWVMTDALTGEPGDDEPPDECRALCGYGLTATAVGYVWGVTGAARAARRWAPEGARVTLGWNPAAARLSLGLSVGF